MESRIKGNMTKVIFIFEGDYLKEIEFLIPLKPNKKHECNHNNVSWKSDHSRWIFNGIFMECERRAVR